MTDARVTRESLGIVLDGNPDLHVTRKAVEVVSDGNPDIHVTRESLEVISDGNPDIHVTRCAIEVLCSRVSNTGGHWADVAPADGEGTVTLLKTIAGELIRTVAGDFVIKE